MNTNTTFIQNKQDAQKKRKWYIIDANGLVLGKVAIKAATLLRGKHKPSFTPHVDCGDFVVVINAKSVKLTGNKETQKLYYRHSEYPGGLRQRTVPEMRKLFPGRMVEIAVRGMIPHTKLGDAIFKKLKVYGGESHPHKAQNPVRIEL